MFNRYIETLVGMVVLGSALFFLAFGYQQLYDSRQLKGYYTFSALFQSAEGLQKGAVVQLSGVRVGKVERIVLNPHNLMAQVFFNVYRHVHIPEDSTVSIVSQSLLSGKLLSITPGNATTPMKPNTTIVRTQSALNFETMISNFFLSSEKK